MSPTEWRDVRQTIRKAIRSSVAASGDGFSKMLGVPVNDDGCEQFQPCHAKVLSFGCKVVEFALVSGTQSILEGVMGFTFVEADPGTALHIGVKQPVDDEQGSLEPSDFPQSGRKLMLPGICCKFA
jgi:hypothetical protein